MGEDDASIEGHISFLLEVTTSRAPIPEYEVLEIALAATQRVRDQMLQEGKSIPEIMSKFPILQHEGMVSILFNKMD